MRLGSDLSGGLTVQGPGGLGGGLTVMVKGLVLTPSILLPDTLIERILNPLANLKCVLESSIVENCVAAVT